MRHTRYWKGWPALCRTLLSLEKQKSSTTITLEQSSARQEKRGLKLNLDKCHIHRGEFLWTLKERTLKEGALWKLRDRALKKQRTLSGNSKKCSGTECSANSGRKHSFNSWRRCSANSGIEISATGNS